MVKATQFPFSISISLKQRSERHIFCVSSLLEWQIRPAQVLALTTVGNTYQQQHKE
uniref:Uncharacterized protein n=1 Tax=Arundo donax TaxID=35708 RepID=A0A0A8YHG2_ARUDO